MLGEYLLHKHEALSSDPQHPGKKQGWKPMSVIPALGRHAHTLSGVSWLSEQMSYKFSKDPASKTRVEIWGKFSDWKRLMLLLRSQA